MSLHPSRDPSRVTPLQGIKAVGELPKLPHGCHYPLTPTPTLQLCHQTVTMGGAPRLCGFRLRCPDGSG
jgi:hypothetical protein